MLSILLDGLIRLLGPIANISKDKREQKDKALVAISNALNETYFYYRHLDEGNPKDLNTEISLARSWSAASIHIRQFNPDLAETCDLKSEYWINPDKFDLKKLGEDKIALENVRNEYRLLLNPK